ncbi:MAG: hypothetical protein HYZ00_08585, partial [Candidatus Hydrogenedentes bacterium]|nr:hypothetical protein [Candidatus Hydrogenedentota bacterium]
MKFTEMLIADISGGVFVDEVFMLKDPEGARRLADGVMMTLKSLHKNKGNIIAFEPKL